MRILLVSSAPYNPPQGGSTRGNLAWLRHLVAQGHDVRVVCSSAAGAGGLSRLGAIDVHSVRNLILHASAVGDEIRAYRPDRVLVSSEDLGHRLLREAAAAALDRLIYIAHTPQWFPFGPASWNPEPEAAELVRRALAVVTIGEHMADYVRRHLGRAAAVVHPPIYGPGPWRNLARFGSGAVLMVNPCAVKGLSIFLELADAFPAVEFAALEGWGTTTSDRAELARCPNVRMLARVADIEEALACATLLVMPSLWYEGFGLIAMEAMLRGLPVVASDSGGLQEAKRGTGYLLSVRSITTWKRDWDETHMPVAEIPPQNLDPWKDAVRRLLNDREAYEAESARSRAAARSFVSLLDAAEFERLLLNVAPQKTTPVTSPKRGAMKILLAHNSVYFPSLGGGDKSNRLLMEALAARGHQVRVFTRIEKFDQASHERYLLQLEQRGVPFTVEDNGEVRFELHGVDVHVLTRRAELRAAFQAHIEAFDPDIIVTSTDDPGQLLFDLALRAPRARVIHLVRATIAVPFGPDSSGVNPRKTELLRRADGVVGVSRYVAGYVRQWSGIDAIHVPISLLDPGGEPPDLGHFENPFVTLVNPCAVKGISIFLALADRLPHLRFAAVPTWGTLPEELEELRRRSNVTLLPQADNIDDILRLTRVLLVPSVWAEARSRICPEAMSRGIPVVASDVGGLPEAKLGVPYLLPVNPVRRYQASVDSSMVPVAEVPPQEVEPWMVALERLTTDRAHWDEIARQSRRAALDYVAEISVIPFEQFLESSLRKPKKEAPARPRHVSVESLSADRKKLLDLLAKKRAAAKAHAASFPGIEKTGAAPRLFCFPWAGGGTRTYANWRARLAGLAEVVPVRLPGRENHVLTKPFEDMRELVAALREAIEPWVRTPYAFFGHSMGAAVAFELIRALREASLPLPISLHVSAARSPVFRLHHVPPPDPTHEQFLEELKRLGGLPPEVLADERLLGLTLPALEADSRLYRRYAFVPGEPLDIPIHAYWGAVDPHITETHMKRWAEMTRARFTLTRFDGGHFYLVSERDRLLSALAANLKPI
jgi:surfactin synthase thioesterase subunit/glycosyltransferase involved in cell wall biosynthesis